MAGAPTAPNDRTGRATSPTTTADPGAPEAERLISDVETLKAISDPTRLRIIETMVTRPGGAWSVKELAAALKVPQTRLYHHIDLLVERELLRVAEQRVVSGIIETRYRVAALSLRLDPKLVGAGGAEGAATRDVLAAILDEVRDDLTRVLGIPGAADVGSPRRPFVTRGVARLTPDRAAELRRRLEAVIGEFDSPSDDPAADTYRLLIAMYAEPGSEEDSRG